MWKIKLTKLTSISQIDKVGENFLLFVEWRNSVESFKLKLKEHTVSCPYLESNIGVIISLESCQLAIRIRKLCVYIYFKNYVTQTCLLFRLNNDSGDDDHGERNVAMPADVSVVSILEEKHYMFF